MSFEFGECVLDLYRRELFRASIVVATAPQVFDLLVYLVKNRERVVSRDDLLAAVWNGRIVSESTWPVTSTRCARRSATVAGNRASFERWPAGDSDSSALSAMNFLSA